MGAPNLCWAPLFTMNKLVQAIIVLAAVASALPEDRFVEDAPLPQTALVGMLQDWHATLDKPDQHLAQQCYALAVQALPSNKRHQLPLKTALKEFLKAHPQCTRTTTKLQNEVLKSKLAVPASTTVSMTLMEKAGRRRRRLAVAEGVAGAVVRQLIRSLRHLSKNPGIPS